MTLKKIRAGLVTAILAAVAIRILWWSIEPLVPYLIGALIMVSILGFVYYRTTRW